MSDDTSKARLEYPLGEFHRDHLTTRSGRRLSELSLERILSGDVAPDDVSVSAETLAQQARIALEAGFDQVAQNLSRAAEMTRIPDAALRPGRSTYYRLLSMSQQIASMYGAELTAAYIREAADAYRDTGLLKMEED